MHSGHHLDKALCCTFKLLHFSMSLSASVQAVAVLRYATVDMTDENSEDYDPEWKYETSADPIFRKNMALELGWEFDEDDDD